MLEDYLNWLADEHRVLAPNGQAVVNVAKLFAGFTKSPQFTAETTGIAATAQLADGRLTVTAGATEGLATVMLTVTDSEGSTYSRPLNIAVSGEGSLASVSVLRTTDDIVSYELFDLSGRQLSNGQSSNCQLMPGGVYLMRATDRTGQRHTIKVIRK